MRKFEKLGFNHENTALFVGKAYLSNLFFMDLGLNETINWPQEFALTVTLSDL